MDNFLPSAYEEPIVYGNYMKFEEGDNVFRVLSSAVVGWEIWGDKKDETGKIVRTPYRFHMNDEISPEYQDLESETNRFRHFWAFVVYNRKAQKIQILEITQAKIRKGIQAIISNKKWGDPKQYDLVVTKTKTGTEAMNVEYMVTPDPKEPMDEAILKQYTAMGINLEALFKNEDPFMKSVSSY